MIQGPFACGVAWAGCRLLRLEMLISLGTRQGHVIGWGIFDGVVSLTPDQGCVAGVAERVVALGPSRNLVIGTGRIFRQITSPADRTPLFARSTQISRATPASRVQLQKDHGPPSPTALLSPSSNFSFATTTPSTHAKSIHDF